MLGINFIIKKNGEVVNVKPEEFFRILKEEIENSKLESYLEENPNNSQSVLNFKEEKDWDGEGF